MLSMTVNGKTIALRADGRLDDLQQWSEPVAEALAAREGLTLNAKHWEVIHLMREYYQEFNISPVLKLLKNALLEKYGKEKAGQDYLGDLFPRHVLIQGTRIAGIPLPLLDAELEHDAAFKQRHAEPESLAFEGRRIEVHASGNLVNLADWNEKLAEFIAIKQGITMTPEHWEVIHFLRAFYFNYGIAPMVKLLKKHITEKLGADKASNKYLYDLFPGGPSRQGSRIAGLPEPQGCIDPY